MIFCVRVADMIQTFHEYNNQVLPKNTHVSSINSELNNIFKKRKLPDSSFQPTDIPIQSDLRSDINPLNKFNPYNIPNISCNVNNKHNQKSSIFFSFF